MRGLPERHGVPGSGLGLASALPSRLLLARRYGTLSDLTCRLLRSKDN